MLFFKNVLIRRSPYKISLLCKHSDGVKERTKLTLEQISVWKIINEVYESIEFADEKPARTVAKIAASAAAMRAFLPIFVV